MNTGAREKVHATIPLGGMDTRLRPVPGSAALIENLRYNPGDGTWSVMEGAVAVGSISTTGVGCTWFHPRPNQRFLVVERRTSSSTNTLSWVQLQSGGALYPIANRRRVENDDGGAEAFLQIGRWLYFTSAHNALTRWDGTRTVPVGFDRPAPTLEAYGPQQGVDVFDRATGNYAGTGGTPAADWKTKTTQRGVGEVVTEASDASAFRYGYAISIVNDLGQESPLGPMVFVSGESDIETGRRMIRLRIPRLPPHCRGVRLWRTINIAGTSETGGFTVYLHSQFPTAHGFDFVDHAPDSELGEEHDPDATGTTPTGALAIAFWQGLIWLGGMADDPNGLRHSHALFREQFPDVNRLQVGQRTGGRILALQPMPRGLAVLTTHGTYMVKGNPVEGFRVEVVDEVVGVAARRAVVYVPHLGLLWLHSSGPKLLQGTLDDDTPSKVVGLGDELTGYWRKMVQGIRIEASVAIYDPDHHEVWFHLPHQGDNRPSLGLVLHTANGAWSARRDWNIAGFAYFRGAVYAVGWDKTSVYKFTRGSRNPQLSANSTITGVYATNPLLLDGSAPYTVDDLSVVGQALGSGDTFEVHTRADKAETWTSQVETSSEYAVHLMRRAPQWGTALWGASGYYNDEDHTVTPVPLRVPAARLLELRLRSSTRMSLAELALSYQPGQAGPPPRGKR